MSAACAPYRTLVRARILWRMSTANDETTVPTSHFLLSGSDILHRSPIMSTKLSAVARVLLGLVFVVFGLNGFFGFLPVPAHPGAAGAFLGALGATGYMFPLL